MSNPYRLNQIYASLLKNGSASVNQLAQEYQVTPTTIRRDLILLEEKGMIVRSRGSAYLREAPVTADLFLEEKKRIAKEATRFVGNHMSLILDSGTTVEALVSELMNDSSLTSLNIVTHSLTTALKASKQFLVSMPGGAVLNEYESLVGPYVDKFFEEINADVAFLGSTGIQDCNGLTVSYPLQISVKKKEVSAAKKKIALLDSSKFLRRGIYEFCSFSDIDVLITVETKQNKEQINRIRKTGIEIILV